MTHRERVLAALQHKETDRIPLDLGGWVTSMSKIVYTNLLQYLNMHDTEVRISDQMQQIVKVDEQILQKLGIDVRHVYLNSELQFWQPVETEDGYEFTDEWGIKWRMPKKSGLYYDMVEHPLANATEKDIETYPFPDLGKKENLDRIEAEVEQLSSIDCAIMLDGGPGLYEYAWFLRGMDKFLMDLVARRKFAEKLLDKILEIRLDQIEKILDRVGDRIDIIAEGDDIAMQKGLIISPQLYRRIIKPRHKKLLSKIREKTDAAIFFHSCGAIYPLIGDLIDIGVDIINPVQVSAKGMDPKRLKKEFGDHIVFWGGGCDPQVMESGTVEEVKRYVRDRCRVFAPGGGFVFAHVHNIQAGAPPQNIIAAFEAARNFRI